MFRNLKYWFTESFDFSRQQQRGLLVLVSLLFLLLIAKTVISLIPSSKNEDFEKYTEKIKAFKNNLKPLDSAGTEIKAANLFKFDPNNLPEEKWKELGLSERQIAVIKRYEAKGGKFYAKEDVKKM